ncbi:hypothetical protein UQ12_27925, partial [Escherichia coli]
MKNIAAVGVLERIRRLAPQGAVPPYRTVEEWRGWELAEGGKNSEGSKRPKHPVRGGKKLKRLGLQPLPPSLFYLSPPPRQAEKTYCRLLFVKKKKTKHSK